MPDFRRGAQAIEESASRKGSGNFRPFVPVVQWRDDKEHKHMLFLTPISDMVTCDLHEWIPVGTGEKADGDSYIKYEQFISRKDAAIGEDHDELEDRLEVKPKERTMGVGVELDPLTETDDKGRERVTGFVVATDTYIRKDDNGNDEEVTQPLVGIVSQAAQNFFGWLSSYDSSQGPIEDTPMSVTRRGKDANTTYDFIPMEGREVDLTPLMAFIDGVSYLDDIDALVALLVNESDDKAAAHMIADALLNQRLEELADKKRYDSLVGPIEAIESKFGKKKNTKKERPKRATRRQPNGDSPETEAEPEAAEKKAAPATRVDRFAKLRAEVEAKQAK